MSCLGKELYVGNIALSIYVETLSPALEQESHFLRESDAEYLSSHLFQSFPSGEHSRHTE